MRDPLVEYYGEGIGTRLTAWPRMVFSLEDMPGEPWSEFLNKIQKITGDSPAMWPHRPWFDSKGDGCFPESNNALPHIEWASYYNQRQLRKYDPELVISASANDSKLFEIVGHEYPTHRQFVQRLPDIVKETRWLVFASTEDVLIFLVRHDFPEWVNALRLWHSENGGKWLYSCEIPDSRG